MVEDTSLSRPVEEGKQWLQISAILTACLTAMISGISFSWSLPFLPKITKDKENYNISEEEVVQFQIISFTTLVIGCPIFSKLTDLIGRKKILLLIIIPDILTWILISTGSHVYSFYAARGLVGISHSIMFAALPSYIGEVSTPYIRGTWGNAMTVFFYTGQLSVTVVGSYLSVQVSSFIFMLVPIVFTVTFSFMPESPVFFLMKGKYGEAEHALRKLRGKQDITTDYEALKADVKRQMTETGTWKDLFMIESNRKALIAVMFLRLAQATSGASLFVIYNGYILEKIGGTLSTEITLIIYMTIHLLLSCCASFIVDILGRRKSLIYSLIPCGAVLFTESIYFYIDEKLTDVNISSFNWVPITGLIIFVTFCAFGIDIMPTIMLGELFSASIKAKGIGFCMIFTGIMQAICSYLFYVLSSNFGMFSPFLIFACCNIMSAILTLYIIPETRGKTLEEIQQNLKKQVQLISENGNIYEKCNQNIL